MCILNMLQTERRAATQGNIAMLEADGDRRWTSMDGDLQVEPLIHLCEWMRQRGRSTPLPLPCVITAALWERLARIPFRIVASTSFEDRVDHLVARARACLDAYGVDDAHARRDEVTLAFSASLPCRAEDPSRQILHLRCGEVDGLGRAVTIGVPEDLPL
jgi:hypothetical protein